MGVLIRAGWGALLRRFSRPPTSAAVRAALRDQAGIGLVDAVDVCSAENGGALVSVDLCLAEGADAREAACRVADRLHERLPHAQISINVLMRPNGDAR
jgi:hypothetical protein